MSKKYQLLITGPVAVGKTTICNVIQMELLRKGLNPKIIPEYLVKEEGPSMLKQYLNKKISNITFQNYILDYYEDVLSELEKSSDDFDLLIYERVPDDSLLCFANLANKKGEFSNLDLLNLYERVLKVDEKFDIPSYIKKNSEFVIIETNSQDYNTKEIMDIIQKDKERGIKNRIILLQNSTDILMRRLKARSRDGESAYSKESIDMFRNHYIKLGNYLLDHTISFIRFVDLGKFI